MDKIGIIDENEMPSLRVGPGNRQTGSHRSLVAKTSLRFFRPKKRYRFYVRLFASSRLCVLALRHGRMMSGTLSLEPSTST